MFLSPVPTLRRKKGTEELVPISCAHTEAEEGAQAELVQSTATLRYEPCIQFINVSQRALHIYFIDGCRKYPPKNEFRTKKFLNPKFLYGISSFCTLSENNSLLHGKISCFCIFLAKNGVFNTDSNSPQ